jgi:predicted transcriptional regulator
MGRPVAGSGIDMENFITIWIDAYKTGKNQSDIARQLGVTPAAVSVKAKKFRNMGIDLPDLSKNSSSGMNVCAAKSLVSKLLGEIEKEETTKEESFSNPTESKEEDLFF